MATTTSARECPICLDKFRDPVVTPCGHLACEPCIKTHARRSSNPYEATCPTCRAPFPIVTPDMSIVPKKYHIFISPPLRRVFLGDADDSSRDAMIEKLNAENARLKGRVTTLIVDKDLLMDRCEAAQCALARLTADERTARLARDEAREEARIAKLNLEELQARHDALALKSRRQGLQLAANGKRTSRHAALDDSMRASSDDSPEFSRASIDGPGARPIKPMPKRPKLRSTHAVSPERTVEQSPPRPTVSALRRRALFTSPESSPSLESAPRTSARSDRILCDLTTRRNARVARYMDSSSGDEADSHDERSNIEDFAEARPSPSPRTFYGARLPSFANFLRDPRNFEQL